MPSSDIGDRPSLFVGRFLVADWRDADTQPAGDDPNATEIIYRGDVCNCQARVRHDAGRRVVGLVFRNAC